MLFLALICGRHLTSTFQLKHILLQVHTHILSFRLVSLIVAEKI